MGRSKREIMIDLVAELDKFGGIITEIQKAIESKGVTSEGKFSKLAEEIRQIQGISAYRDIVDAVERAYTKGYTLTELVSTIDGLENKNQPPKPDIPVPGGDFNADTATEILPRQFYGKSDLEGELSCPNVTKVGAEAFIGTEYNIVKLPKATVIDKDAFRYSSIKSLYIPSFVWKDDNLVLSDVYENKYGINKIVVADESVPPSDISIQKVGLEVYNHDSTKYWDIYNNVWKNL